MTTVAVVEDDAHILAAVTRGLTERGHVVLGASTGLGALSEIVEQRPDVVVLDLGLPDIDGLELLRMLRAVSTVPVIVATARDDEGEIIRTLDAGADDYVVKPFHYGEFLGRVRAVIRRAEGRPQRGIVRVGELTLDPVTRAVRLAGKPVHLSVKEFALLQALAEEPTRVRSKNELLRDVWGYLSIGQTRTVDAHACRLRKKLSASPRAWVVNVRGVGYRLTEAL